MSCYVVSPTLHFPFSCFVEFFRIKTEDDELYEVVMKVLEKLRGDDDQDVRFFAGAKSFEEVSLFSDDATRNDDQSSEDFDDDSRNEGVESEEKDALVNSVEKNVSESPYNTKADDVVGSEDRESSEVRDEKLETGVENTRGELQGAVIPGEIKQEEGSSSSCGEESSALVVEEVLSSLIETIETK